MNWHSDDNHFLFPNKFVDEDLVRCVNLKLQAHVIVGTSGTTQEKKWIALPKEAILASAESVNRHLCVDASDTWLLSLPIYHIGGFSVLARSYLSHCKVTHREEPWHPQNFLNTLVQESVTIVSMVPTQVFDVVAQKISAPKQLRCALVGGGSLSEELYFSARELGWPLIPTYGLTECSSQVATAELKSLCSSTFPRLKVLSHNNVKIQAEGQIYIEGSNLLSGYFSFSDQWDFYRRKELGFLTQDLGQSSLLNGNHYLKVLGRADSIKKVKGVLMNEVDLTSAFKEFSKSSTCEVIAIPDVRQENQLVVVSDGESIFNLKKYLRDFNSHFEGSFKISACYVVDKIPRTELGKLKKFELCKLLQGET